MDRSQFALTLVVAAVAGLVGGAVSDLARGEPAAAQERVAQVIEAREFRVVDEHGTVRAMLGLTDKGPRLRLCAENGDAHLSAGVAPDGSVGFNVSDSSGTPRLGGQVQPDGSTTLAVMGAAGTGRSIGFGVQPDGAMSFGISGQSGKSAVGLGVRSDQTRYLTLGDDDAGPRCVLSVLPQAQKAQLQVGRGEDGPQHVCIVSELAGCSLNVGGHDQGAAVQVGVADGLSRLVIRDDKPQSRIVLGAGDARKYEMLLQDGAGMPRIVMSEDPHGTWGIGCVDAGGKQFYGVPR